MDTALNEIMTLGTSLQRSIDWNLLQKLTGRIEIDFIGKIRWDQVKVLHLLGSNQSMDLQSLQQTASVRPGVYVDDTGTWVAAIGIALPEMEDCIKRCSPDLETLSVRFTLLRYVEITHLTGLKELIAERNTMLTRISGLRALPKLKRLNLSNTGVGPSLHIEELTALEELWVEHTPVEELRTEFALPGMRVLRAHSSRIGNTKFLANLPGLRALDLSNTSIDGISDLDGCSELEVLDLSHTIIEEVPALDRFENLHTLNLARTKVGSLEQVSFPDHLACLDVSGTPIGNIPDHIGRLKELQTLDLSEMDLESLPLWLPDLELNFSLGTEAGIRLRETTIKGVDMSIFSRSREMILQWFGLQKRLAESKRSDRINAGKFPRYGIDFGNAFSFISYRSADLLSRFNNFLICIDEPGVEMVWGQSVLQKHHFSIRNLVDRTRSMKHRLDSDELESRMLADYILDSRYYIPYDDDMLENGPFFYEDYFKEALGAVHISGCVSDIAEISIPDEIRTEEDREVKGFLRSPDRWRIRWDREFQPDCSSEDVPEQINEIKVVFLGDGEAGKSHTIARLLNDGGEPLDFTGASTPGIVIRDKEYDINGRSIKVHFWDFGGQEILHAMHRMFLTEQTLYVVLVNVREGNQQERARYWLHNIRSFANGAPVLLVLNKMDMNRNASVNENDLRALYPNLTEVVKMSAMNDDVASLRNNLIAAMKRQIGAMDILEYPFLAAWNELKRRLQTMSEPYIRGMQYARLSEECGVDRDDNIRKELLNWFSELGVSFCYGGSARLEDYVVLRPTWITNAIYIIIFNKIDDVKNGMVSHETIFRLLNPCSPNADSVRRSAADEVYKVEEVEYVLNVIRKFRLSFLVKDNVEFMPMLCQANSTPAANEYANDPNAYEFQMEYDYLPDNVIHRLMVERHRELDSDNVWLTGARFVYGNTGLSAVVKSEGNLLRIIVKASKPRYTADMYLDLLKDDLTRINDEMGLTVTEKKVVYKYMGTTELFDYDDLMLALELGDLEIRSRKQRKKIPIQDILHQTDHRQDEDRAQLILDITRACQKMQDNQNTREFNEDGRTMYIRDMLSVKYHVSDQHQTGETITQKSPGRIDLDIRKEKDVEWTILEAVNIKGQGKNQLKNWEQHLCRLLDHYNAIGRPFLFHVSYVECPKEKFHSLYTTFWSHLRTYSPKGYSIQTDATRELDLGFGGQAANLFIKAAECVYHCGGLPMTVYHYFVRIG